VKREVAELKSRLDLWSVDTEIDVPAWVAESHALCLSLVYSPEILAAVQRSGDLASINLPLEYLEKARSDARQRVVAAGLRLGALLSSNQD